MINRKKYKSFSQEGKEQVDAAGIYYELNSGRILRQKADANNKKVFAAGVKKLNLSPQHAKALFNTIYNASWENMKRFKFVVDKAKLQKSFSTTNRSFHNKGRRVSRRPFFRPHDKRT